MGERGGHQQSHPSLPSPERASEGLTPCPAPKSNPWGPGPNQAPLHSNTPIRPGVRGSILARHGPHPWAWLHWTQDQCPQSKVAHDRPTGRDCLHSPRTPRSSHWGAARLPGLAPVPGHLRLSRELGRDTGVRLRSQWPSPRGHLPPLEHGDGCRWAQEEKMVAGLVLAPHPPTPGPHMWHN